MDKRQFLRHALSVAALGAIGTGSARAQSGASGAPMKIVVATPAGGASDTAARLMAQALGKNLGQQVVVENRPGGNGVPAIQAVLAAPADGRTLLWAMASMAGMPTLVPSSPVKSMGEFVPVAGVVSLAYGLFVNPKLPVQTVPEFAAHLKANPQKLAYGTGVLSEYMMTVNYLSAVGAQATRVPYKGGAQLLPDLISGELQFYIGALTPALPHVRSGKLRLLATLPDRGVVVPGTPSLADFGVSSDGLPAWNGLVAAPGTPLAQASRLSQEVNRVLSEPELRSALEAQGFRVTGGTPAQLGEAIASATKAWQQFVRDYNIPKE